MSEQQVTDLRSLLDTMAAAGKAPSSADRAKMAKALGEMFGVAPDEVAILALSAKSKSLQFVIPEQLAVVGTIPLTSTNALAARTARERKPEILNNFGVARRTAVFEGVPLGRSQGESIQKIMSAPILNGANVVGVIQISHKAESVSAAGPDFAQKDLSVLTSLSPTLQQFVNLFQIE
jgi:hypothetical protein